MKFIAEVTNHNYTAALAFVQAHYADLFHPSLSRITLKTAARHEPGANGLHIRFGGESFITIKSGRRTVAEFVCTLVHELTHVQQAVNAPGMTRDQREAEARAAGFRAFQYYFQKPA